MARRNRGEGREMRGITDLIRGDFITYNCMKYKSFQTSISAGNDIGTIWLERHDRPAEAIAIFIDVTLTWTKVIKYNIVTFLITTRNFNSRLTHEIGISSGFSSAILEMEKWLTKYGEEVYDFYN